MERVQRFAVVRASGTTRFEVQGFALHPRYVAYAGLAVIVLGAGLAGWYAPVTRLIIGSTALIGGILASLGMLTDFDRAAGRGVVTHIDRSLELTRVDKGVRASVDGRALHGHPLGVQLRIYVSPRHHPPQFRVYLVFEDEVLVIGATPMEQSARDLADAVARAADLQEVIVGPAPVSLASMGLAFAYLFVLIGVTLAGALLPGGSQTDGSTALPLVGRALVQAVAMLAAHWSFAGIARSHLASLANALRNDCVANVREDDARRAHLEPELPPLEATGRGARFACSRCRELFAEADLRRDDGEFVCGNCDEVAVTSAKYR